MIDLGNPRAKAVRPTQKVKTIAGHIAHRALTHSHTPWTDETHTLKHSLSHPPRALTPHTHSPSRTHHTLPLANSFNLTGISSIHYMQLEERGVRVWHVANVGPGELVTWVVIKKHHHGKAPVDPCVPLIHVPAAVDPGRTPTVSNEFVGKIHRSHQNVKTRHQERTLRRKQKKLAAEHNFQRQVVDLVQQVERVKSCVCQWCFQTLSSTTALQRHQSNGCTRVRGKTKKSLLQTESETVVSDGFPQPPDVGSAISDEGVLRENELTRGYAWTALRARVTETVGRRATLLLEQAFKRGVAKGGDRQSCFQMVSPVMFVVYVIHPPHPFTHSHTTCRKNSWLVVYLLKNVCRGTLFSRGCPPD